MTPLMLDMYCDLRAQALCARQIRCGLTNAAQMTTCIANATADCSGPSDPVNRALKGLNTFDAMQARRCIDAYQTLSCHAGSFGSPAECDDVFRVDAGIGAPCANDGQCRQGRCPVAAGTTCAACTAYTASGQPCTSAAGAAPCDPATDFCPPTGNDGGLTDGGGTPRCVPLLADGAPCISRPFVANRCLSTQCIVPLDGGSQVGVCGYTPTGQPCDDHLFARCAPGDYCRGLRYVLGPMGEVRVSTGLCTPRNAFGQACTNEQFDDSCPFGNGSCLNGTCKQFGTYAQPTGGECRRSDECADNQCIGGNFFFYEPDGGPDLVPGTCAQRVDAGAPCGAMAPCSIPNTCQAGICVPLRGPGGMCTNAGLQCQNLLTCPDAGMSPNTCQAGQMVSQGCGAGAPNLGCEAPAVCLRDGGTAAGPGVCVAQLPAGATCYGNGECATTLCRRSDGGTASFAGPGTCLAYCF